MPIWASIVAGSSTIAAAISSGIAPVCANIVAAAPVLASPCTELLCAASKPNVLTICAASPVAAVPVIAALVCASASGVADVCPATPLTWGA